MQPLCCCTRGAAVAIGSPSPCAAVDRGVVQGLTWRFKFRFVRAIKKGNRWWVLLEVVLTRIGKRCANIHLRGDVHVTQTDLSFVVCDFCQLLFWRREPKLCRSVRDLEENELGRGSGYMNSIPVCSWSPNGVQHWRPHKDPSSSMRLPRQLKPRRSPQQHSPSPTPSPHLFS